MVELVHLHAQVKGTVLDGSGLGGRAIEVALDLGVSAGAAGASVTDGREEEEGRGSDIVCKCVQTTQWQTCTMGAEGRIRRMIGRDRSIRSSRLG
jgi:hypothetical protein